MSTSNEHQDDPDDVHEPLQKCARTKTGRDMCVAPVYTEEWYAENGNYSTTVQFASNSTALCMIMHEPMCDVQVESLPDNWRVSNSETQSLEFDCATLTCGHAFHPCAIALHFCVCNMRCPVCRVGNSERLNVEVLPQTMSQALKNKQANIQRNDVEAPTEESVMAVLSRTQMQVQFRAPVFSTRDVNLGTRLVQTVDTRIVTSRETIAAALQILSTFHSEDNLNESMVTFDLHRSFQRILRSTVEKQVDSNSSTVFQINHPFVPALITSVNMSSREIWDSLFNCFTMSGNPIECSGSIPLYCAAAAGVEPVAYIISHYEQRQPTPKLTLQLNVAMIYNIAVDFLREAGESRVAWVPEPESLLELLDNEIYVSIF